MYSYRKLLLKSNSGMLVFAIINPLNNFKNSLHLRVFLVSVYQKKSEHISDTIKWHNSFELLNAVRKHMHTAGVSIDENDPWNIKRESYRVN